MRQPLLCFVSILSAGVFLGGGSPAGAAGELTLTVVDAATQKPMPCRMHLRTEKERPQRVSKMVTWHDHFVFPGTVKLKLPRGTYHFEIERGPEYVTRNGYFVVENQAKDDQRVDLRRACDMADEGWWSGDLHVHRPTKDAELLMLADDLHVAGMITWTEKKSDWSKRPVPGEPVKRFDGNRYCDLLAGESSTDGGTLLFLNLGNPLVDGEPGDINPLGLLSSARAQTNVWIDISRPTALDLPLWLATGRVDSIEICGDQFCRGETTDDDLGLPRDKKLMPGPTGIGRWTHEIYYHLLNCGLRIPPSAGSGSGESANPVGYNRVYVWVDKDQFNYEAWWKAFRMGRTVVTNGPLLRPVAEGRYPGHVFQAPAGERLAIEVALNITTRDTISYFELVKNGQVAQSMRYDDLAKTGRFAPLSFDASGWFLVRAVTDVEETYRFATSAPWYVEIGEQPKRVSKVSAHFFLDWLNERREAIEKKGVALSAEAKKAWDSATEFWERLAAESNGD